MQFVVTLRAGRSTSTVHIEAKTLDNLLAFCKEVFNATVSEVKQVVYENNAAPLADDPKRNKQFIKIFCITKDKKFTQQYAFSYVKKDLTSKDFQRLFTEHITIANNAVHSVYNIAEKNIQPFILLYVLKAFIKKNNLISS